jgi:chromosome segregation ATPase
MLNKDDLKQIANLLEPINKRLDGLEQGQQGLKQTLDTQGKTIQGLKQAVVRVETGQGQLREDMKTIDLKVDVVLDYQKKAHTEIMDRLFESNEANGQEQQRLEKRIERIEKHLGLPPLK